MLSAAIALALAAFAALLTVRAALAGKKPGKRPAAKVRPAPRADSEPVARLSQAIRFKTVSHYDYSKIDPKAHSGFLSWLDSAYPNVSRTCERTVFGDFGVLYVWKGSDQNLPPCLLMAHYDVVPAEGEWEKKAFDGEVSDGFVWGRGSLDIKVALISAMEAAENLIKGGFVPKRSVYLAFGGDEEVGGKKGAGEIGKYLAGKGVRFSWAVDEGSVIVEGMLKFVDRPLALVGISEKGHLNLRIVAYGEGGHASMPSPHTGAGILSRAIVRLENRPSPARFTPTVKAFMKWVSPYCPFGVRLFFANSFAFSPILKLIFARSRKTNALIRTTAAVTMLSGSEKENVLPLVASANVNIRILPGESVDAAIARVKRIVEMKKIETKSFEGVEKTREKRIVEVQYPYPEDSNGALPESPTHGEGWDAVSAALAACAPEAAIVPFLVTASTDTKHYAPIADSIYRITPLVLTDEETKGIHGPNERVSLENYGRCIVFYEALMRR